MKRSLLESVVMVLPLLASDGAFHSDIDVLREWFSTGTRDPNEKDEDGWSLLYSPTLAFAVSIEDEPRKCRSDWFASSCIVAQPSTRVF